MADSMTPVVRAVVEGLVKALEGVEFSGFALIEGSERFCTDPDCENRVSQGHRPTCSVARALGEAAKLLSALDAPPPVTGKGEGPFDLIREWERTPNRDAYVATFIDRAYLAGQASATPPPPPVTDEDVERVALWCRWQIVIAQVLVKDYDWPSMDNYRMLARALLATGWRMPEEGK